MTSDHEQGYPLLKDEPGVMDECAKLEELKQRIGKDAEVVSRPKIQKVSDYVRTQVGFEKFYSPKLISIGPLHDGDFRLGKQRKDIWTAMYLKDTNQAAYDLCEGILKHWGELKDLFEDRYNYGSYYSTKLMIDGCSVLQVLDKSNNHSDPQQELKVSIDQLIKVHEDLLLLENQVPYKLLKILCPDQAKLKKCFRNFLQVHGFRIQVKENNANTGGEGEGELPKGLNKVIVIQAEDQLDIDKHEPVHLLDYLRRARLMSDNSSGTSQIPEKITINHKSLHLRKYRIGTIRELKAAGIRVKKDPDNSNSVYPSLVAGQSQLPRLIVDGSTALIFLNLIAYELCPDFRNDLEISSYIVFLSSLIDQPEDVKELRSAGILRNELASDKEVADLFNKMDSVLVPETARYAHIRNEIEQHIQSRRGRIKMLDWMREAYNTYFRSPWTIIALLAAALGLVLTFIQTWFAIHPKGS